MENKLLKDLRAEHGYTQAKVCELTGLAPTVYGDIERGTRKMGIHSATLLADLYGVSIDYIVGRTQTRSTTLEESNLDAMEKVVIDEFISLPQAQRDQVLAFMRRCIQRLDDDTTETVSYTAAELEDQAKEEGAA